MELCFSETRDAEIRHRKVVTRWADQDVLGLQVPVDDPLEMGGLYAVQNLAEMAKKLVSALIRSHDFAQTAAIERHYIEGSLSGPVCRQAKSETVTMLRCVFRERKAISFLNRRRLSDDVLANTFNATGVPAPSRRRKLFRRRPPRGSSQACRG